MERSDSVLVSANPFKKIVNIPTSKSYANRILILASLCPKEVSIKNLPQSTDVVKLISCLKKVGVLFQEEGNITKVINSFPDCETDDDDPILLETGDGGTTNRFLLSFLGAIAPFFPGLTVNFLPSAFSSSFGFSILNIPSYSTSFQSVLPDSSY